MKKLRIVVCLLVLGMSFSAALGQPKSNLLHEKKISIQMSKRPLVTVFARLTYKYDIPIGFEESSLDSGHDHYEFETNMPPPELRQLVDGEKEWKSSYAKFDEHLITLDFVDTRLEVVMNSIVKQMENYDWEIRDDVINIFPIRGRDVSFKKLLELRVDHFQLGKGTKVGLIQTELYSLPEFRKFLAANDLSVDFERGTSLAFIDRLLPSNIEFSDLTFLELLNRITKNKRGCWILQKNKQKKSKDRSFLEILI